MNSVFAAAHNKSLKRVAQTAGSGLSFALLRSLGINL